MSHFDDAPPPSRLRSLPTWLRVLLAITPILACGLILCAGGVFYLQQPQSDSAGTATAAQAQTGIAGTATALRLLQGEGAELTSTAAALLDSESEIASATALAANRLQSLTQAALTQAALPSASPRPATATLPPAPTGQVATRTPTATSTEPVVLTLIECRGQDGTVTIDNSISTSLHARTSVSFTLGRGVHHLQIFWASDPGQNVDTNIDMQRDTAMVFGQC